MPAAAAPGDRGPEAAALQGPTSWTRYPRLPRPGKKHGLDRPTDLRMRATAIAAPAFHAQTTAANRHSPHAWAVDVRPPSPLRLSTDKPSSNPRCTTDTSIATGPKRHPCPRHRHARLSHSCPSNDRYALVRDRPVHIRTLRPSLAWRVRGCRLRMGSILSTEHSYPAPRPVCFF